MSEANHLLSTGPLLDIHELLLKRRDRPILGHKTIGFKDQERELYDNRDCLSSQISSSRPRL